MEKAAVYTKKIQYLPADAGNHFQPVQWLYYAISTSYLTADMEHRVKQGYDFLHAALF